MCFGYSVNLAPRFARVRCQPLTKTDSKSTCIQHDLLIVRAATAAAVLSMIPRTNWHTVTSSFSRRLFIEAVVVWLLCVRPPRRWIELPRLLWSAGTRYPPDTCELFAATKSTPWSDGKRPSDGARTTRSTLSSTNPSLSFATSGGIFRATCERGALCRRGPGSLYTAVSLVCVLTARYRG